MENQTVPQSTDREVLEAIYENTRKTKNYMKWQLIITIALVVIPLIATIVIIPFALNSLGSMYGGDLLNSTSVDTSSIENLIQQYQQ